MAYIQAIIVAGLKTLLRGPGSNYWFVNEGSEPCSEVIAQVSKGQKSLLSGTHIQMTQENRMLPVPKRLSKTLIKKNQEV